MLNMPIDILNEADKKFFDDNMLTSDDLELDIDDEIDFGFSYNNISLKNIHDHYLLSDFNLDPSVFSDSSSSSSSSSSIPIELLMPEVEIKLEPPSPHPATIQLPSETIWSSEEFYPQISIPGSDSKIEVEITPPNTPPSVEEVCVSPVSSLPSVQDKTVSTVTLVKTTVPNSTTVTVTPTVRIQPKQTNNGIKAEKLYICNDTPQQTNLLGNEAEYIENSYSPITPQPLLLTPEQLANLKVLGITTTDKLVSSSSKLAQILPSSLNNLSSTMTSVNQTQTVPIVSGGSDSSVRNSSIDLKAMKRQQRMIKNRESACLSRKKKKEYVQKLEVEIKRLTNENNRLRTENAYLKQRLLELENKKNGNAFLPKDVKKTTCLMAVIFMLTVNLSPFGGLLMGYNTPSAQSSPNVHGGGRSLLWKMNENEEVDANFVPEFIDNTVSSNDLNDNLTDYSNGRNISVCPTFINKTESLRFPGQTELQIYRSPQKSFDDFLEAIHRREDTFYFVSFSGDHLLLPATAHNKTLRPRMSLVMPAMTFNDSVKHPKEHVTMMQIDCEVMNTKLVYVKESVVPSHLRQHENHTSNAFTDDIYSVDKSARKQKKARSIRKTEKVQP